MRPLLLVLPVLAACAQFPALDAQLTAADRAAPYPALIPLGPLLARADAMGSAPAPSPEQRVAALAARAAALRRPVLTPADRARLATPVAGRPPLG